MTLAVLGFLSPLYYYVILCFRYGAFPFRFLLRSTVLVLSIMGFILVHSEYMTGIGRAIKDKVLFGHAFRNLTVINAVECFMFCQQERLCKAFQMCRKNKDCQLLSSNQFQSPSAFVTMIGCTYYDTQVLRNWSHCYYYHDHYHHHRHYNHDH